MNELYLQDKFILFMGYSVPQNKELMRVFRDLDMVEQLGRRTAYFGALSTHCCNFVQFPVRLKK